MARSKAGAGCPFIITVDYNEYLPQHQGYHFEQVIPRPKTMTTNMEVGDYSILGHPGVVVERKSKADLYQSFGKKKRENMIERISIMDATARFAVMMIEAEYLDVVSNPPRHSKLHPRSLSGTIIALQQRHPNVHWVFMRDRDCAEMMTYRILERYYTDQTEQANEINHVDRNQEPRGLESRDDSPVPAGVDGGQ